MNLHQLRIFCTVVEQSSYTKAAEALFLTQPAVSLQIQALERSLGVKLLERVNQQFLVTEAGQALYQCALPMLNAMGWSTSPNQGRKSVANALDGLKTGNIVHPFRTSLVFIAGFGQVLFSLNVNVHRERGVKSFHTSSFLPTSYLFTH